MQRCMDILEWQALLQATRLPAVKHPLPADLICSYAALRQGQRSMHGSTPDLNGGSFALSPAELNALRQGHPLLRCLNVLNHVMQQPAAAPFCSQVKPTPGMSGNNIASRDMHRLVSPSRHMLVVCLALT